MIDTLRVQREYFDKRLKELSGIEDSVERYKHEMCLLSDANLAELSYRSGLIRGKIMGLGLERFMSDIVDGMNQTCLRVCPSDLKSRPSVIMYNNLFRAHRKIKI